MSSYVSGVSKPAAASTGFDTPESAATNRRPGLGPPHASSTRDSGVPSSTSSTWLRTTSPTIVTMTVPGEPAVPIDRNHDAPFARMCAAVASVSTLLTRVGLLWPARPALTSASHPSCTVANKPRWYGGSSVGSGSRPSITSRSAFSSPKRYSSGPSTIETLKSPSIPIAPISSAARRSRRLRRVLPLGGAERLFGPDGEGRDRETLDHSVRIAAHQRAVLERRRLALGSVGDCVVASSARSAHRPPLHAGGEPGSASSAQTRGCELFDDCGRSQTPSCVEAGTAAGGHVLLDCLDRLLRQQVRVAEPSHSHLAGSRRWRRAPSWNRRSSASCISRT